MDNNVAWYIDKQVERTIANLEKHNISGFYVTNEIQLQEKIKELIPEHSLVAVGDSMTLFETGIINLLRNGKYNFLDKYREEITREEKKEIYRRSFSADTFLCSTNALTEEGELYNIDGNGSRVAAMIYGPEQVIVVVGFNKIVKNLEEAEKRVRNYAAPLDAKRLHKNTPCASLGYCVDCKSEERICNDFVVIKRQFTKGRIKIIIVGKQLGY
jgi:L-lactate utilization protein LutC